jgi:hypothetical protein
MSAEPLALDAAYDVTAVEVPTQEEVDALQDAVHGENPELVAEGDQR